MDKKDLYIKAKLQEDKKISSQANEIFEKFEGGINLENKEKPKERKVLKISLNQAILAFTSLIVVVVLGGNLYAHLNGKPNLYSAIKNLFVKEDNYTASEITVDQTVESNGIKLTLKTVAMDENVLITKYVAEGEQLANEFYTYADLEEAEIKINKIRLVQAGHDIGESGYENYTLKDVTKMRQEVVAKLQAVGLEETEAQELEKLATEAYQEYSGEQLGLESCSDEKAKELITETIAMFESKVSSKYQIMQSNYKLQDFNIDAISQKIEKSGNQYIIYNVYNVDTISDLASTFNLSINVTQIGSTKGTWNFSTELEKARLDTRVETIDFYENNSIEVKASAEAEKNVTIEAKKLVISDFSTVLMIQTRVKEENRQAFLNYGYGLPCVYVVRDEQGNALGTGKLSEDKYEKILSTGGEIKYTDRIILENVDKDTKKLHVDVFVMNKNYADIQSLELDIEAARNANKPVELTQSYASKDVQVSFKYPGDWTTKETMSSEVILVGPENVDGNAPTITIRKISKEDYDNIKESTVDYGHGELLEEGEITIAGAKGFYRITTLIDIGTYIKQKAIVLEKDEQYFAIYYAVYTDTQYARYEETFNKILETIEFVEPEKSYVAYYMDNSSDSPERVKVYEDNTATVQISESALVAFDKKLETKIEANVEYQITGVSSKIVGMDFLNSIEGGAYVGSCLFIYGENNELYLVDMHEGIATGKFEAKEINVKNRLTRPQCEDIVIDGEIPAVAVIVYDKDGQGYTISRDGTVEKYIEETQNSNQEQTEISITDEKAKKVIQKYLDIYGACCGGPLEMLEYNAVLDMEFNVDYNVAVTENDHQYVYTGVKFKDFKNEMLKYMTEDVYVQEFSYYYKDKNGLLFAENVGASGMRYEILKIEYVESNGEYRVQVNELFGDEVNQVTISFKLVESDGNIVVSYWGVG